MKQVSWELANTLRKIDVLGHLDPVDSEYRLHSILVMYAVYLALMDHIPTGFRVDPEKPEWLVAFIELPMPDGSTQQVSWRLRQHARPWDGHTAEETQRCVEAVVKAAFKRGDEERMKRGLHLLKTDKDDAQTVEERIEGADERTPGTATKQPLALTALQEMRLRVQPGWKSWEDG
jgi:hypothetical protein